MRVALKGEDPRIALRAAPASGDVRARLARIDARSAEPWTQPLLREIGARPGDAAQHLADTLGVPKDVLKRRVRALKELGLTESLEIGYRLSPRGQALLARAPR